MQPDIYAIAASGMAAQQTQMDLIAANLANVATTRTARGGPYHSRAALLQTAAPFSDALAQAQTSSVDDFLEPTFLRTSNLMADDSAPDADYDNDAAADWATPPGVEVAAIVSQANAVTDKNAGASDVDPIEQMVGLVAAGRSYDANVAVLQAAKQMDLEASDISRFA